MSDDINTLRSQLQQLAKLHAEGTLGEEAYRESRATLERRLVDAVMSGGGVAPEAGAAGRKSTRLLGGLVTLAVVMAVAGYMWSAAYLRAGAGPDAAALPATAGMPTAGAEPSAGTLSGSVVLAPELASRASPGDTVFIFARASGGAGMPLAVLRKQVKDLPVEFTLDDSLAMVPASKLSNVSQAVVTARISKTGDAIPQPGDLAGQTASVAVGTSGLRIVIDTVVKH